MEENTKTIGEYVDVIRRRKWSLILPALIVIGLAVTLAFTLPRTYRSTSVILIEEQDLPREFVAVAVTSYAEERLQSINQRIMSAARLQNVIDRFNLYPKLRRKYGPEMIHEKMKKDIELKMISADVKDPRTGAAKSATIAFSLSYVGEDPDVAQRVANGLISLYLEENLKVREQAMAGTSKFLQDEAKTLQNDLARVDAQISSFKERHINELPELFQFNLQEVSAIDRDQDRLRDELKTLKEREEYLAVQLAGIPLDQSAGNPSEDELLLKELKAKLVQLQVRYSDKNAAVAEAKTEIAQIEKRLAAAEKTNHDTHSQTADQMRSPAYVTLASQLAGVRSDIDSVQRQLNGLAAKRQRFAQRVEATPRNEEKNKALTMDRTSLQSKYDDLLRKLMEARVAQGLEKDQMGERFTIIDPAQRPEKPASPNVPAILLIGLFLGIGSGAGTAALREFLDPSVRSAHDLERATSFPVLGAIPLIVTEKDRLRASRKRKLIVLTVIGVLAAAIVLFHFFVMDLEVFYARVMQRMGM